MFELERRWQSAFRWLCCSERGLDVAFDRDDVLHSAERLRASKRTAGGLHAPRGWSMWWIEQVDVLAVERLERWSGRLGLVPGHAPLGHTRTALEAIGGRRDDLGEDRAGAPALRRLE